jgi:glycosyltransferase involved in cell wall biosynthesis
MKPRVSVVVPTHGRPELLERCLVALTAQTLPWREYEVIVVADGPDDRARALVESSACVARYVELRRRRGPAAARNAGWRAAAADIVAFTDDDTLPAADWLAAGLAAFASGCDAVAGRVVMPISSTPTDYERDSARLAEAEFVTANCFVRAATLRAIGGFDERFKLAWREDSDLQFRLLESGAIVARAPEAVVVHPVRPARWGVSLAQQRKVEFDALLYKKHRALYRERIRGRPRVDYYAAVAALATGAAAAAVGAADVALVAVAAWLVLTARFSAQRLAGVQHGWRHVSEMLVTSAAIPLLAVFWRIVGAIRFRVVLL